MLIDDSNLKSNPSRFSNICVFEEEAHLVENSKTPKSAVPVEAATQDGVYQPAKMNPVFYEEKSKKRSIERTRKRAARFILEDPDVMEAEDRPKEVYFGSHGDNKQMRKKMAEKAEYEEDNFLRLQVTKKDKHMQRRFLSGDLADTSSKFDHLNVLLQSSDDEADYQAPLSKKKQKKLKRSRGKKNKKRKR